MIVEFLPEAKSELLDAVEYYESELPGLGQRFRNELDILRMVEPFGRPALARRRRVRGATPTRLSDCRPLPPPVAKCAGRYAAFSASLRTYRDK